MIAHPDAEASRYPPQKNRNEDSFPRKEEQRRNCADMKGGHKKCGDPVGLVVGWPLSFERLKLHDCRSPSCVSDVATRRWVSRTGAALCNSFVASLVSYRYQDCAE